MVYVGCVEGLLSPFPGNFSFLLDCITSTRSISATVTRIKNEIVMDVPRS
jgi:hypothetical protein